MPHLARPLVGRDAQRAQLAVQRRALHADELRRARDVAAEAVDLRQQILALEDLARLAQRQAHQVLGAAVDRQRHVGADLLRQHVGRDHGAGSPPARIISRSMLLRSSRTLPGQSCACSTAIASSPMRRGARPEALRQLADEELDELGNVLAPFGEARHAQRHHVEAVIEILAEAALLHLALEVAAGGRDDAHVDRDLLRPAEAQELLLDKHPQHLALRLERHVGDFVDVKRAAVRFFQRADLARPAGAILGAEQLFLDAVRRHGRGVEHDEGPIRAMRFQVDHARRQFLARARRAADEDAAVGRRHAIEAAAQLVDRRRLADHLRETVERSRSSLTSRFSLEASSARSVTSTRRSALNGFSM